MQARDWWASKYANSAGVKTGNEVVDFMFNRTIQLLCQGIAFDSGAPPSFQFVAGSPWWSNSSFHDNMYILRGLLTANMKDESRKLLNWMRDYQWQQEERPTYWLTRFDGFPISRHLPEGPDLGYMANVVLGLCPIIFTESTGSDALETENTYQMLKTIVEYAASKLLTKKEGTYYLATQTIQDVHSEAFGEMARQDAFLLLAMRPLFRKAAFYAERLKADNERRSVWLDIANNLFVPKDEEGYILTDENGHRSGGFMNWIPVFCLSPFDPQILPEQIEIWKEETHNHNFPWRKAVGIASALQWKDGNFLQATLNNILTDGINGPGYVAEINVSGHMRREKNSSMGNLPPFATGQGSFLFAIAESFARGSIWDNKIMLGPIPDTNLYDQEWSATNIRTLNGAVVDMERAAGKIKGSITPRADKEMEAVVTRPDDMIGRPLKMTVNGKTSRVGKNEAVVIEVPSGTEAVFVLSVW